MSLEKPQLEARSPEVLVASWNRVDVVGRKMKGLTASGHMHRDQVILGAGGLALFLLVFLLCHALAVPIIITSILLNLPIPFYMRWMNQVVISRARRRYGQTLEEPGLLVGIVLEVDDNEYGRDVGVVSFEKDWLYFEGEMCSFSLNRSDFPRSISGWEDSLKVSPRGTLDAVTVRFTMPREYAPRFRTQVREWADSAGISTGGIRRLPPLEELKRTTLGISRPTGTIALAAIWLLGMTPCLSAISIGKHLDKILSATIVGFIVGVGALALNRLWVRGQKKAALEKLRHIRSLLDKSSIES